MNWDILIFQNDPQRYNLLTQYSKEILADWIKNNLVQTKMRVNNAYLIKGIVEADTDLYLISGEMSGALLALGFEMREPKEIWHHREFYCRFTKDCHERMLRFKNWVI